MDFEIVSHGAEWESAIPALQTHLWGPDPVENRAYFEWKYLANPYLRRPRIRLAIAGRVAVGMVGVYGARWEAGAPPEVFDAPCLADLVIRPDHRDGRLMHRLLAAAAAGVDEEGFRAAFAFSAGRAPQQLACMQTGWRAAGVLEIARRAPGPTVPPAARPQERRRHVDVSVETTCRSGEMGGLAERSATDGRIRHVRDAEFFDWRYRNPLCRYRFVYARGDGLEGFLVLQTHVRRDRGQVNVVDWEAGDDDVFGSLVRAAIGAHELDRIELWAAALTPGSRRLLADLGFEFVAPPSTVGRAHRERKRRTAVLVHLPAGGSDRASESRGPRLLDLADWDLRGIYSDFY